MFPRDVKFLQPKSPKVTDSKGNSKTAAALDSSSSDSVSSNDSFTESELESDLRYRKASEVKTQQQRQSTASQSDVILDDLAILSSKGYTIKDEISSGTFAKVRHAQHRTRTKVQKLAVKIIDKTKGSHQFVEKFLPRELSIWPELHHSAIIKVHKIISIESRVYVFMELATKGSVIQYLQKNGAVGEALARRWFSSLARALKYCHKRGVAHRDVKCDNLLLDANLDLKLGDFGFTRQCVENRMGKQQFSETYCGSVAYVAPEVINGSPYDPLKADVWSSGICLFVILNNAMPFDDSNIYKLRKDQVDRNWKFSSAVERCLSENSKKLIARILEPDPKSRMTLDQALNSTWMKR